MIVLKMTTRRLFFAYFAVVLIFGVIVDNSYAEEPQRITGGRKALKGEIPYQALIVGRNICGGSIISKRHILTAAHCTLIPDAHEKLVVKTGSINAYDGGETHLIEKIKIHEDFRSGLQGAWLNDIALITLKKDIEENEFQKPIALPTSDTPAKVLAKVSGFGMIDSDGPRSKFLRTITTYVLSNEKCQKIINDTEDKPIRISSTHLCAMKSIGIGVCKGDSGGPLVYHNELIGIVSSAVPCAVGPEVFTRVYKFVDWIRNAMA